MQSKINKKFIKKKVFLKKNLIFFQLREIKKLLSLY